MSDFIPHMTAVPIPQRDPAKHVNYNLGIVLGVDDFEQEFTYLAGRDQWLARDVIGYGTVSGLRVVIEKDDPKGPRVVVDCGVALSPLGQLIRVPAAQCAYLNDWLNLPKTKSELISHAGPPPTTARVYVVLCYRDCATDDVPIPGEPCRSEDNLMAPSRLSDDFTLELRFDPPSQTEEDAVRDFVSWLEQIEISDTAISPSMEEFVKTLRDASQVIGSPPDFMFGSPPASLMINSADRCEYFDAAFRLWVTELRPRWRPNFFAGVSCCSGASASSRDEAEMCLLLAEVELPVVLNAGWEVQDPNLIVVKEERRPYLLTLRMLQEFMRCGLTSPAAGNVGLRGPQGLQGPSGPTGGKGDTGASGPTGGKGDTGASGPTGGKGDTGPSGPTGGKGDTGPAGSGGPFVSPDSLVRIIGLNWTHDGTSDFVPIVRIATPIGERPRTLGMVVVAFGVDNLKPANLKPANLREVTFGPGGLDERSFQIFILDTTDLASTYKRLNVRRPNLGPEPNLEVDLIPVSVTIDKTTGKITGATELPGNTIATKAVAMVCDATFLAQRLLPSRLERRIYVEIKGDFIPAVQPPSSPPPATYLDGNFLGGKLPTGDGVSGGTFWSWFSLPQAF